MAHRSEDSSDSEGSRSGSAGSHGPMRATRMRKLDTSELTKTALEDWTVQHVAAWLQSIGFEAHAQAFVEEMVSGEELVELDDTDMRELGVTKLGDRKRLRKRVKALVAKGTSHALDATSSGHDEDTSTSESADAIEFVAKYKKKTAKLKATHNISLDQLIDRLSDEFGVRVRVQCRDDDGDLFKIKSDKALLDAMEGESKVELVCMKAVGKKSAATGSGGAAAAKKK